MAVDLLRSAELNISDDFFKPSQPWLRDFREVEKLMISLDSFDPNLFYASPDLVMSKPTALPGHEI